MALALASMVSLSALAHQGPHFFPGNLVVVVEGCGVHRGTCARVPHGTGNGTGNSSAGGYGDNQAAPITLFQYAPTGTAYVTYVNSLMLPQIASAGNFPISGEYGSSSEGTLQLSGDDYYLTVMGYGINAAAFDAAYYPNPGFSGDRYGAAPSGALAQSGSLTGQSYTPVARVVALIDADGNVNTATALYNVFDTNNPRSAFTVDGTMNIYASGQGSGCDSTGGVFYTPFGSPNAAPTPITGLDANASSSCTTQPTIAQDTRDVQILNDTLYVSVDSKEGSGSNRDFIGTLGTPPATSLYLPPASAPYSTGPTMLSGFGNSGGTGRVKLSTTQTNGINASGEYINLSPVNYFFASPTVLYVADSGSPKNDSAGNESTYSLCGAGGLQKWVNVNGTWTWEYTLYQGLNLVANSSCSGDTDGTTGLYGLTGVVVGTGPDAVVELYATNYTIADLDPTYLYGITDVLSATTNPGDESFTQLAAAPADSNFKGVAFAPSTTTQSVPRSGTACDGEYHGMFAGNVTVSAGQNCIFVGPGSGIRGSVQLNGGNLTLMGSQVTGNVQLNGSGTFIISAGSIITGDLRIQDLFGGGAAMDEVCASTVDGSLELQNNAAPVSIGTGLASAGNACPGNTIYGNLQIESNTAAVSAVGNRVGSNLTDQKNTAPTVDNYNTVRGSLQNQNNTSATQVFWNTVGGILDCRDDSSITGGDNRARFKQGQCATF